MLRQFRKAGVWALRAAIAATVVVAFMVGLALATLQSAWGKEQLRALIVREANRYLTATLDIGRLDGSLFRGIELDKVTLTQDGRRIVAIDAVTVSYDPRELWQKGVVIRRLRLTRPRVLLERRPDGRWNLGALVRRAPGPEQERSGPGRPIEIESIQLVDAGVSIGEPLTFGPAHVPAEFTSLDASLAFSYEPGRWSVSIDRLSFVGRRPDLDVASLTGHLSHRAQGLQFTDFSVKTPRSTYRLDGLIATARHPTQFDLTVHADRFAFQEWGGIIHGLANIAVDASFDTTLKGPSTALATKLALEGSGGRVAGHLTLDTAVPGWHGTGLVDVRRLDLARWLNNSDRRSDITGRVAFNLDLDLGGHFPRGAFQFDGPHAMYQGYGADDVHTRGRLTREEAVIDSLTAVAYGADIAPTSGTIGLGRPFPYRFSGSMSGLDLRLLPAPVPVPHVESDLAFDFDVTGRFRRPFIAGRASFDPSTFLGARIGAGTLGTIDTRAKPLQFSGDGDVEGLSLPRLGRDLDVAWMQDPRYAGIVSGRFTVEGSGSNAHELSIDARGRIGQASIFGGRASNADVTLEISDGTLRTSYAGVLTDINPAIPFDDPQLAASLSGSADVRATIRGLLVRQPTLDDYDISGTLGLVSSTIRGIHLDSASIDATLADGRMAVDRMEIAGPTIAGHLSGSIALDAGRTTDVRYDVSRADLGRLASLVGRKLSGTAATTGQISGPSTALHASGTLSVSHFGGFGAAVLSATTEYDLTAPAGIKHLRDLTARATSRVSHLTIAGQEVDQVSGTIGIAQNRLDVDAGATKADSQIATVSGTAQIRPAEHAAHVEALTAMLGPARWRLQENQPPTLTWSSEGLAITPATFVAGAAGDEHLRLSGTWRRDGSGALRVQASHVFLETFERVHQPEARFGGILDLDATIRGTASTPTVAGTIGISNGRVERVVFDRLAGRVSYADDAFAVDLRLDQGPGIWLTAHGTVPLSLVSRTAPDRAMNVSVVSSPIDLGLLEGVTRVITRASGRLLLDVRGTGSGRTPRLDGSVALADGAFEVTATGVHYQHGRAALRFAGNSVLVDSLHLEDSNGRSLDLHGALGSGALGTDSLSLDARARGFEVLDDLLGNIAVDANLQIRGSLQRPRVTGEATITGDTLKADEILERTLFHPYSTEPVSLAPLDAVAALNPWDRLGLDITLHIPSTLRLTGSNVQITSGTPLGLSDINVRVGGDLYLYKDPGQALSITGSLYRLSGQYAFQGRRFDIAEGASSINFTGDLDPQLYVTVTRIISGVETRVTLAGTLHKPELRLASTPPLSESDILSLIVFNATPTQLNSTQQQELAVRAGALAAGFLATPLLSAIQSDLGLQAFAIEPATASTGGGATVTVGEQLAPGLVARFSRQFGGVQPFNEVTVEYYLSRLFRIRATFSDAQSLTAQALFRRAERAGVDFLVFLSF